MRPLASSEAPPLNIRYALPSSNERPPFSNQVDEVSDFREKCSAYTNLLQAQGKLTYYVRTLKMRRLQEKLKQSEDRIGNLLKADERQPIFIQVRQL